MTLHVFADESKKRGFILAAAIVDQGDLKELRATVAGLRLPRQRRLHFAKESDGRRSVIIRTFAQANLLVNIYNAAGFRQDKLGRDAAIARLADDAVSMGAARLGSSWNWTIPCFSLTGASSARGWPRTTAMTFATNISAPTKKACWLSPTRWRGAGPRAATGERRLRISSPR